jgi:hypothetical protein
VLTFDVPSRPVTVIQMMAEVNSLGSTQFLKSSTRILSLAGQSPADAKRKTEAIAVRLLEYGFPGADLMDANDGEEIVNLAEGPGGLGDRAGAPNSQTAAEYAQRGALIVMFKRTHALPKIRVHCLKQGNPPAWCLQWPTLTSNPSPPAFFEYPAGPAVK